MADQATKARAIAALDEAIEAHTAAREKLVAVIALKDLNRQDTRVEEAERAALDVTIGNLENERAEYRAAAVVVSAPSRDEISTVRDRIKEIRDLAVADAARQAGQDLIRDVLRTALDLRAQNAKA